MPAPAPARFRRPALAVLATAALVFTACADGNPIKRLITSEPTVTRWTSDSLLLATEPELLFRVLPDPGGALVVPVATVGSQGIRSLKLSARGWRAVDANYMRAGKMLTPYAANQPQKPVRMFRGMWQPGASALDSLGCAVVIPMARALATGSPSEGRLPPFATNGTRPPLSNQHVMTPAEIAKNLENIGTLVAPSSGIAPGQLPLYERRVHQIPTGISNSATLVLEYNDLRPLPDSLAAYGERPRQLIVVLDKGTYGPRTTYSFSTLGSPGTQPRLRFLDYMDVDNDGVPELLFGLLETERAPLFTTVLRFENDAWRETFRFFGNRCAF